MNREKGVSSLALVLMLLILGSLLLQGMSQQDRSFASRVSMESQSLRRQAIVQSALEWGKMHSWGNHMVHHAIYYKQNYSYFGIIEALSGAPFDVSFISFDDIRENKDLLNDFDVIINVGDADTAQSGGENWANPEILTAVRKFVYNGGGFIGVGEPAAHQWQGKFFQLDDILGVEEESGFNLNTDKYNWEEHRDHFILEDTDGTVDFGEGKKNIFALPDTKILIQKDQEVQMAVKTFGKGRGVYISGLPYSFKNSRILYRSVLVCGSRG